MASKVPLKQRLLTRPVAEAMMSPSGILLAGGAAAILIATGAPLVLAPLGALAAWAAKVATKVPRNPKADRIDPFTLPAPWRDFVTDALEARRRFGVTVGQTDAGPVRERLQSIGDRLGDGVEEMWRAARRGVQLVSARQQLAPNAEARLTQLEAELLQDTDNVTLRRTAEALRSQVDAAHRIDETIEQTYDRLRMLGSVLDESVARAAELSVEVADDGRLGGLGDDVERAVSEMESLRQALEETETQPGVA